MNAHVVGRNAYARSASLLPPTPLTLWRHPGILLLRSCPPAPAHLLTCRLLHSCSTITAAAPLPRPQALEAMYAKYATPAPQGQDNLNTPA